MAQLTEQQKALALLKKYQSGQCTPEEAELVERWYDSFKNAKIGANDQSVIDEATQNIILQTWPNRHSAGRMLSMRVWISIAASVIIGISVVATILLRENTLPPANNKVYLTGKGQRKQIVLPDGSSVTLNVASRLKLESFSKNTRVVSLAGEAFFTVAKDRRHPFIVRTEKIQTHVLGTSFNIFAYADEPVVRIAVATGKVQVEASGHPGQVLGSSMTANHLFTYNKANGSHTLAKADAGKSDAWLSHHLCFSKATLSEIARALERTFNTPVSLSGTPAETAHYTVKFDHENLDKILKQLSELTGAGYHRTQNGIIISVAALDKAP